MRREGNYGEGNYGEDNYLKHLSPRISRRQFLTRALAVAFTGAVAAVAYAEHKTGLLSLILTEKLAIWVESAMDYTGDTVELSTAPFLNERTYSVEQITVSITSAANPTHVRKAQLTFIQYKSGAVIQLKPTSFGRRDSLLIESTGVSGPVAPVSGDYEYSESGKMEERNIDMQMPARDQNGRMYGPANLVDRLPNIVGSHTNVSASG